MQCVSSCRRFKADLNTRVYNADILEHVNSNLVAGDFKIFFQNIQGLFPNKFNLMKLLDS